MSYLEEYQQKLTTAEEAVKVITDTNRQCNENVKKITRFS